VPGSTGDGAGVDSGIQFTLAMRDQNDQPHPGIERIDGRSVSLYPSKGILGPAHDGAAEGAVKALSDWPNQQYVNIWVVSQIDHNGGTDGVQGYAYPPLDPTLAGLDGVVILSSAVGTTGNVKASTKQGKVLTHEMGHFLGLFETFKDTLACDEESDCTSEGDQVCDTPPTIYQSSCGDPACDGNQQVHNYMDDTGELCENMFTQGQKDRMRSTLETLRPGLLTSSGGTPVNQTDLSIKSSDLPPFLCNAGAGVVPHLLITNLGSDLVTFPVVKYRVDGGVWHASTYSDSLDSGSDALVDLPQFTSYPVGLHTIEYEVEPPTGVTDDDDSNNHLSGTFTIPSDSKLVTVSFQLDFQGHDNSYLISSGGNLFGGGGPFMDEMQGTQVSRQHCLPAGCYSISVLDSRGDGQSFTSGSYEILTSLGSLVLNQGNWGSIQNHTVCVGGAQGAVLIPSPPQNSSGGSADLEPPIVSLITPVNGTYFNQAAPLIIPIEATAVDSGGIAQVDLYEGSHRIGTATTAPYVVKWDTRPLQDGVYHLSAVAYDLSGNTSTSASISVTLDRTPPVGSLTSPAHLLDVANAGASLAITASAGDRIGVKRVEFFKDGVLLGSATASPYQLTVNPSAWPIGAYTLSAKIVDLADNTFTPSSISVVRSPQAGSLTGAAVNAVFKGSSVGCYSRTALQGLMSGYGCMSGCSSSIGGNTIDVNADGKLNALDFIGMMGSLCHE
jgi:hypothetical protein